MPGCRVKLWTARAPTVSLTARQRVLATILAINYRLYGGLTRAVGIINTAALPDLGNEEMKRASG
jgi:hypothetical protein